jgi:hypothetical protein
MAVNLERDKYFFHYTTRDRAFGGILAEGALRLSTYGNMRDPLESQPWRFTFGGYGLDRGDDEALLAQLNEYERFESEVNEGVRDNSRLLSLTIDADPNAREQEPFCRGWARARMWEQYAENHCGVCLVFDRKILTDAVLRSAGGLVVYNQPVVYDGRGLMKPIVDHKALKEERGYPARYINDSHESLFFTKIRDWETEHEFRFVVLGRDDSPVSVNYGDSLTAVIAGYRLPEWEQPAVITTCEKEDVQALRMKWKNWKPGLVDLSTDSRGPGAADGG